MKVNLIGAIASATAATCFIVGIVFYLLYLMANDFPSLTENVQGHIQFIAANQTLLQSWYLIIYLGFGLCLVVLLASLYQQAIVSNDLLRWISTALGLIWAVLVIAVGLLASVGIEFILTLNQHQAEQAEILWLVLQTLINALGGDNEIIGALWIGLTSLGMRTATRISRLVTYSGYLACIMGCLTLFPPLSDLGASFGILSIFWFLLLAVALLDDNELS